MKKKKPHKGPQRLTQAALAPPPPPPMLFTQAVLDGPGGGPALAMLRPHVLGCQKCKLHQDRTHAVFGEGNAARPPVMFVGEAPGENEDRSGRPFVGKAGELLDRMIVAMGLTRDSVYIANTVCCRPLDQNRMNRKPEEEEIKACLPFLVGQLRAVKPKTLVALGASAVFALLKQTTKLADLRGRWMDWEGTPLRVTYHPAFLLRNPAAKAAAWEDLVAVMDRLGLGKRTSGQVDKALELGRRENTDGRDTADRTGGAQALTDDGEGDPPRGGDGHCF